MKKIIISVFLLVLCFSFILQLASCSDPNETTLHTDITEQDSENTTKQSVTTEKETEMTDAITERLPDDITENTDYVTETWTAIDINFETDREYAEKEQLYVIFDAIFTNRETKTTLTIPGFWYGGNTFTVRFAPTEYGIWDFETVCETDASLNGKSGTVAANAYKGDLLIYKHGFVTTNGTKHFVYADGTPFFYLGDTHWNTVTVVIRQQCLYFWFLQKGW